MALLKRNFNKVETKFSDFFEQGTARWPSEKHDFLRNHHQNIDSFYLSNISLEKLQVKNLPENILQEVQAAYKAFEKGEEYS